ncbi:MAG: metallophosphoesterase, partial [Clostridia bacterium]|nr:metallophosphoesterase [Clostridia bacterium]
MKKSFKMTSAVLSLALFGSVAFGACNAGDAPLPTYNVTVNASVGGTLTASAQKVTEGGTVVFTVSPETGYVLESLFINGSEVEVSGNTFTVKGVLRDFNAVAKFATPNVTVQFDANGGEAVADEARLYGGEFGKLPVPIKKGSRFLGWKLNGKGDYVTQFTPVESYGTVMLVAAWETITEEEKELLKPFSSSCTFYDQAATKYGVVWHTEVVPAASVVQIVEGNIDDFTNARTIQADSEAWLTEYISTVVIDELKFSTEYSVRFGDIAADVWSDTYHFTTREETIEDFEFFYVADTQETYLIESHPDSTYVGDSYFSYVLKDAIARFGKTEFIMHGGDIVNYGAETEHWKECLQSVKGDLFEMPMQVTSGNHEDGNWYSAGHETTGKMFHYDLPEGQNLKAGPFYSFDYGPVHFVQLLTNDTFNNKGHIGKNQLEWLKKDLAAARQNPNVKWIIAAMHEGIYSPSATPTALASNYHNKELGEDLNPIFDEYNVEFVLCGHHHLYLNTFPIVCDETQTEYINKVNGVRPVTTQTRYVEHDGVQV